MRILINSLTRKRLHRLRQQEKFLSLHKIVIPLIGEGWEFSENEELIDNGGQVYWDKPTFRYFQKEKELFYYDDSISDLKEAKKVLKSWSTKNSVVRIWDDGLVKLTWSGELVSWESIRHRVDNLVE